MTSFTGEAARNLPGSIIVSMFFSAKYFWALVNFWKTYSNTSTFELRYMLGSPPPRFIMFILSSVTLSRESSTSSTISHSDVF